MGFNRSTTKTVFIACILQAALLPFAVPAAEITVKGLDEQPALAKYLQERVIDEIHASETPYSPSAIRARLQKALKARGYYQARLTSPSDSETDFLIQPGPQYKISSYEITGYDAGETLNLKAGEPLIAQDVLNAQKTLYDNILTHECFYKLSVKNRVFLKENNPLADIFFDVASSGAATFGSTTFLGAEKIDREYLNKFLRYAPDDCWNPMTLEDSKNALLQTGLISTIDTKLPEAPTDDGSVPIVMNLKPRAPHTVKLGANYNTSEGPGISAAWVHRNFFGSGEELAVSTKISSVLQNLGLDFTKPFFLSDNQTFKFTSALERQDTDAYEEFSLNAVGSITRKISRYWNGSLGIGLDLLQVKENGAKSENFGLVSLPGTLTYDSRDNVLDAHDGHTLRLVLTPVIDVLGTTAPFLKTRATGTTYFDLKRAILALRASIGSIFGNSTNDLPASYRFYAGGGGSIRGYGYQEAGPFDSSNDPAGGRSLLETTAELRFKVTEKIGAVAFVDAGGAYDSSYPDFKGGTYLGAGVGMRYYTDFGPIRFDVGVPLNKKGHLDQNYQIYISIGQAF